MTHINISPLKERHIASMTEIEQLCFSMPWRSEDFYCDLDNSIAHYAVLEVDGQAVAYVGSRVIPPEMAITNVAVHPSFRRLGYAKQVICAFLERAGELGVTTVTLEARESNEAAISLYSSFGFERVGKRKGYYELPTEDAVLMEKQLF